MRIRNLSEKLSFLPNNTIMYIPVFIKREPCFLAVVKHAFLLSLYISVLQYFVFCGMLFCCACFPIFIKETPVQLTGSKKPKMKTANCDCKISGKFLTCPFQQFFLPVGKEVRRGISL
jgi:hypothetical protein